MSNITLPRAVVWRLHAAFRDADKTIRPSGEKSDYSAEIAILDAALAEPEQKPEPATNEQIVKAGGECAVVDDEYLLDFRDGFRAAERFHGIRGSK